MQSPCDFNFYADYYAYIAQSGIKCANAIFKAISPIQRIDITTFDIFEDAQAARDDFDFAIRTSYETVFTNVYQTTSMQNSFVALANHVKKDFASVDIFVTEFGVKVLPAYASLSNVFGEPIDTGNIRDYGDADTCNALYGYAAYGFATYGS